MKNTSQRREDILTKLKDLGSVTVANLAQQYSVSSVTIRNDLTFLEQQGTLMRSYGGAINKQNLIDESSIEEKSALNSPQKCNIAKIAASLIQDGDSVIFDSGTTTEKITEYLNESQNIIVMTNGLNVAQKLLRHDNVKLMMPGGNLRKKSLSFYGVQAEENLKAYHFDKLFLGVDGFHLERGITTHNEHEASLNRTMASIANEVIVVADSSKFGKVSLHKILAPKNISILITDSNIPDDYVAGLEKQGIKIIIV